MSLQHYRQQNGKRANPQPRGQLPTTPRPNSEREYPDLFGSADSRRLSANMVNAAEILVPPTKAVPRGWRDVLIGEEMTIYLGFLVENLGFVRLSVLKQQSLETFKTKWSSFNSQKMPDLNDVKELIDSLNSMLRGASKIDQVGLGRAYHNLRVIRRLLELQELLKSGPKEFDREVRDRAQDAFPGEVECRLFVKQSGAPEKGVN